MLPIASHRLQPGGPDALEETLGRLSKKAGVRATIVLDRTSGAILKTSGQISAIRTSKSSGNPGLSQGTSSFSTNAQSNQTSESQGAEELAALVWSFISTAGGLVQEIDTEVCC
jgi:dynein light chain roadblock-type